MMSRKVVVVITCITLGILASIALFPGISDHITGKDKNEPIATDSKGPNTSIKERLFPAFHPILSEGEKSIDNKNIGDRPTLRYLIENPIKISDVFISQENNGIRLDLKYPQIEGLLDTSVQDRINEELKSYADMLISVLDTLGSDFKESHLSYRVCANYNNILCISIYHSLWSGKDSISAQETFLFELVNGTKLELGDIFNSSADFPRVLNRNIEAYILKKNLEERILKAPFKGIRERQSYELSDSTLRIILDKNDEFVFHYMDEGNSSISFNLSQFGKLTDIYYKYAEPEKDIYVSKEKKRKMITNSVVEAFYELYSEKDRYNSYVSGRIFHGIHNTELQQKLNQMCSYNGGKEFERLIATYKKEKLNTEDKPHIFRSYNVTGNYCSVICIRSTQTYSIPGVMTNSSIWHNSYNIETGKELELEDFFKKDFHWKSSIITYIEKNNIEREEDQKLSNIEQMIDKADFWFDEDQLWINLAPEVYAEDILQNKNVFSIPFDYLGEENCIIRE
jgi:hypothetical protein